MDEIVQYEFNEARASRTICTTIFYSSLLIALILITDNKITRYFDQYPFFQYFSIFLFILFCLILVWRWLQIKNNKLYISIRNNTVTIPNIYLAAKQYNIDQIYSVEFLMLRRTQIGFILGIRNKSRHLIDKSIFKKGEDFQHFVELLGKLVRGLNESENIETITQLSNQQITNKNIFVNIIAGILVGLYLLSLLSSNDVYAAESFLLLAANTQDIFSDLEIYRIASSFFFHTSPLHITLNVMVLGLIGPSLERTFSSVRIIFIVFAANIFAVFNSNIFSPFDASIGSSGGIFGLWGALLYLNIRYGKYLPASVNLLPTNRLILILGVELILEIFFLSNVDYFSHIGGLIAGFVIVMFMPLGSKLENIAKPSRNEKVLCSVLIAFYFLSMSYFFYDAGPFLRDLALSSAA